MSWNQRYARTREQFVAENCALLEQQIGQALATKGHAWLALAGGSTPFPIYQQLARAALDFSKVTVVVTDERWVPASHEANNLSKLKASFVQARGMRFVSLTPNDDFLQDIPNAEHACKVLQELPERFDAVVLGMGTDGHFASLFPGAAELEFGYQCTEAALVVTPEPLPKEAPFSRISLSLSRILHADCLSLWTTGAAKLDLLSSSAAKSPQVRPASSADAKSGLPISHLLQCAWQRWEAGQLANVDIIWSP